MQRRSTLAVVSLLALGLAACGGTKQDTATPAKPAQTTSQPATTTTAAVSDFGVPECDEYINKYLACLDTKFPEAGRAMARQQLEATKASWKQAASTPEGKASLATGCKAATDAAKQAMSAYGCTW